MFAEDLVDERAVAALADGLDWLRAQAASFDPRSPRPAPVSTRRRYGSWPGISPRPPRAAVYGRFGTSVGRHPTLTAYLDRRRQSRCGTAGQARRGVCSPSGAPGERFVRDGDARHAAGVPPQAVRIGGFPSVIGAEPAAMLAKEISTPAPTGSGPCSSVPAIRPIGAQRLGTGRREEPRAHGWAWTSTSTRPRPLRLRPCRSRRCTSGTTSR